jgi:release factor glutamine methyltransferase
LRFQVLDEVYEPSDDSFLLADYLNDEIRSKDIILDLGTGIGIQAIIAASLKEDIQIIATDVNPVAVQNAKKNALINKVSDRIDFINCDLFQPLFTKKYFSLIIFNPPYLPLPLTDQKKKDWISRSWIQGLDIDIINTFLSESSVFLKNNGRILMILSTLSKFVFKEWETIYSFEKLAERSFFFEKITLFKIMKD